MTHKTNHVDAKLDVLREVDKMMAFLTAAPSPRKLHVPHCLAVQLRAEGTWNDNLYIEDGRKRK
jgi:hypothetical protein